jgi:hypothetical protein
MKKTYLFFVVILMLLSSLSLLLYTTQSYAQQQQSGAVNKAMSYVSRLAAVYSSCIHAHNPEMLTACTNVLNGLNRHFDQLFTDERGDISKILGSAP